jgi:hypothetical protein
MAKKKPQGRRISQREYIENSREKLALEEKREAERRARIVIDPSLVQKLDFTMDNIEVGRN